MHEPAKKDDSCEHQYLQVPARLPLVCEALGSQINLLTPISGG